MKSKLRGLDGRSFIGHGALTGGVSPRAA